MAFLYQVMFDNLDEIHGAVTSTLHETEQRQCHGHASGCDWKAGYTFNLAGWTRWFGCNRDGAILADASGISFVRRRMSGFRFCGSHRERHSFAVGTPGTGESPTVRNFRRHTIVRLPARNSFVIGSVAAIGSVSMDLIRRSQNGCGGAPMIGSSRARMPMKQLRTDIYWDFLARLSR